MAPEKFRHINTAGSAQIRRTSDLGISYAFNVLLMYS